jgi:hypothetical protein
MIKKLLMILLGALVLQACAEDKAPLLPKNRIVGYYGNFYSAHMGALGEYPPDEMIEKLEKEVKRWQEADPNTPVIPVIHYIATVAQSSPGEGDLYRLHMPDAQIRKAIDLANQIHGIVTLDVQDGFSNVEKEIPRLEEYLKLPNVMLALDPEFSMKSDEPPGRKIGTMDAEDINFVVNYLAELVRKNNLPPKILVVHRFTQHMVTNYKDIKIVPEVQIVMDMDGFGDQALKRDSYQAYIAKEPVEFTGFKLFYKQDRETGGELYTPAQIIKFKPVPMYILYQ